MVPHTATQASSLSLDPRTFRWLTFLFRCFWKHMHGLGGLDTHPSIFRIQTHRVQLSLVGITFTHASRTKQPVSPKSILQCQPPTTAGTSERPAFTLNVPWTKYVHSLTQRSWLLLFYLTSRGRRLLPSQCSSGKLVAYQTLATRRGQLSADTFRSTLGAVSFLSDAKQQQNWVGISKPSFKVRTRPKTAVFLVNEKALLTGANNQLTNGPTLRFRQLACVKSKQKSYM